MVCIGVVLGRKESQKEINTYFAKGIMFCLFGLVLHLVRKNHKEEKFMFALVWRLMAKTHEEETHGYFAILLLYM
jgi:hypothetical protein